MKITIEFESLDEFEAFRTSGKKTRGGKKEETVEETVEAAPVVQATPAPAPQPQPQPIAPAVHQAFPGANGSTPPVHPMVKAILERIDGAIASGQPADNVVMWFRNQIGPEAANATLDQIKQVFIPRMNEQQLNQLAPLRGLVR